MVKRVITSQLLEDFFHELRLEEKSRATLEKYRHDIYHYARFMAGEPLSRERNLQYKQALEQQYALSSANSMIAAVNSLLRFAGWEDLRIRRFRIQKNTYCAEDTELTREEYMKLVRTAESSGKRRLSLLLQTIGATGIRVSELSFITREAAERGEAIVTCKGKTRRVFIVSRLRKKLLQFARQQGIRSGMLFVTKDGRPLNRSSIWRQMKDLCTLAGVAAKKVFPHNLRHLFARTFYAMEKDIAKLADILGHSNINTTRIYIISTGAEHRKKLERMCLLI